MGLVWWMLVEKGLPSWSFPSFHQHDNEYDEGDDDANDVRWLVDAVNRC